MKFFIEEKKRFNSEPHTAYVDYENAFDKVKKCKLLHVIHDKYMLNLTLKNILRT